MRISDWSSDVCSSDLPDLTLGAGARRFEQTNDTAAIFSLSIPIPLFNNGRAALSQATAERQRADAQRRVAALDVDQAIARAQADAANAATSAVAASGPALAAAEEAARIARIDRKSVVSGKSVSVRVDVGGRSSMKQKKKKLENNEH